MAYDSWYNVSSNEYDQWYDTSSKVYSLQYNAGSDIYAFYSRMRSFVYSHEFDRAEKSYNKFLSKIEKANEPENADSISNAKFDTTLQEASSVDDLESIVDTQVNECVQALMAEWADLSAEIDTFEKYEDNADAIEEFHEHIEESASQIFVMIRKYGISYTELILQSDSTTREKYKDFEDFRYCIYEDACDIVKEGIYEDLLKEIKDYYYDGIIKDAKDSVTYSDWSDARSDTYELWSDSRGTVYDDWSDTRSDLYSFYSDMRSRLYDGDSEKINKEFEKFKKDVAKME